MQLAIFFDVERDAEGNAMIRPPGDDFAIPTPQKMFERCCYLNGITDAAAVARLWKRREAGEL